uniref:DUF721 domain-containing protein n=1 Tax=candidate division CPR3 bacterium TaxID=2268181 RepID=A0A7C4M2Q5_UNCC3
MQKISRINLDEIERKNIGPAAKAALICYIVNKFIKKTFDKDFIKEIKVISFKDGVIYFSATNTCYIQELKIKEKEIIKGVNNLLEKKLIEKIKFKINKKESY